MVDEEGYLHGFILELTKVLDKSLVLENQKRETVSFRFRNDKAQE